MECTECLGEQCPKGAEYFAKVTAAAKYIDGNASYGITLDDVTSAGGFSRTQWFGGRKDCVEHVLGKRIVYVTSPTPDEPRRQLLETMDPAHEEWSRNKPNRRS